VGERCYQERLKPQIPPDSVFGASERLSPQDVAKGGNFPISEINNEIDP